LWNSIITTKNKIQNEDIKKITKGKNSSIIIKKFYEKENCEKIIERISSTRVKKDSKKFNHIGPFLMNYTTKKEEYFQKAKKANIIFKKIFSEIENPVNEIKSTISKSFPDYEVIETKEKEQNYALCTIRRHKNGKSVPLHKDNVMYEGIEYNVSKINSQFSCILHLQATEVGGNLSIYKKEWEKKLEKFREIEFGYDNILKNDQEVDTIKSEVGDLVILNPNYLHEVTKIHGKSDRITLGMFFGIQKESKKIFSWA